MHSRKTRPKLPILDGIMDAVSNGLSPFMALQVVGVCNHLYLFDCSFTIDVHQYLKAFVKCLKL